MSAKRVPGLREAVVAGVAEEVEAVSVEAVAEVVVAVASVAAGADAGRSNPSPFSKFGPPLADWRLVV